jgi:tetratricopeptide (TPR) repeat protein
MDRDGYMEIVFGSDDDSVYALDHDGGYLWRYRTSGNVRSSPTLADINEDGRPDVVFGSDDGFVYALDDRGGQIWNFSTDGAVRGSPAVDVMKKGDGISIIVGSLDTRVYSLDRSGRKVWDYKTSDSIESSAAIFDIDDDGQKEAVIGSNDNMVYVLKSPPYKVWSYLLGGDVKAAPAVDRLGRITVGSEGRDIFMFEMKAVGNAETRRIKTDKGWTTKTIGMSGLVPTWNYTTRGEIVSSAAVDGTGLWNTVVGSFDKSLYFLGGNGTRHRAYSVSKPIESSPAIADIDGDGSREVIFGSDDHIIYVIADNGGTKNSFRTGASVRSSPAVADLTGDGKLEFIIGSDDGRIYAFGDPQEADIAEGEADYNLALQSYEIGRLQDTTEHLNRSFTKWSGLNNTQGLLKVGRMRSRMLADLQFSRAVALFGQGNISQASGMIREILQGYEAAKYRPGYDMALKLSDRLEAETFYLEAKYYIDVGQPENAKGYADSARMLYGRLNDSKGISRVDSLLTGRGNLAAEDAAKPKETGAMAESEGTTTGDEPVTSTTATKKSQLKKNQQKARNRSAKVSTTNPPQDDVTEINKIQQNTLVYAAISVPIIAIVAWVLWGKKHKD